MEAALHKTVNRPATARPSPAAAPVRAASAGAGQVQTTTAASPRLESPYIARFAGSITQMQSRGAPAAERGDGDRMFRTRDGQLVELPDGVTAADAGKLEAEAKAAEKKLGQGPPPRPVPDVKRLLGKPARKEAVKPPAPGKRAGKAGKVPSSVAAAATAAAGLLRAVGTRKVAQYLAQRGAPALRTGISLLHQLRRNEQTHDSAPDKLHQSENSVVIPPSEGHSKSNSAQVTAVDARPAPVADEKKSKATLVSTLADNVPRSIEDVDNFKRDQKAEHVGAGVLKVVQGDSNAVTSTFQDVTQAPPPAPPEHSPEALPPEELAPATAQMNLGEGAVAPLQPEHTDVSNFTKDADGKLAAEGVTQQQLDMVDTGDLAEANQEKKGLETKARTEPAAVQKFAAQQAGAVDQQLRQDERAGRDAIRATRKAVLRGTAQKQQGTRTALEKKREEVAAKINGIYEAAQAKVKKKLADLETESMKRFDAGNAAASKAFEDNVHRELDAYKDDRYSGWFGWARKAKDWLLGMDELPGVKAIFERNRQIFVDTVNTLVEGITADQKRVIQECKDELASARKAIKEYVDSLGPGLKDIGQKAAEDMTAKLGALDELVARKDEELQAKLKDKQAAAIKAIDEKIEKMKEEMSGALAKLGKLLLLAAKKFFTWALDKVGFSLSTIEGIINKGVAVLKAIFTAPIQFVKNLVRAASTGFENFGKNFLTHLKNAVFEWLTGSLQGLILPSSWDFKGILGVVFQMLGITYANFRAHLVRLIPEPVVKALETTFALVKTLVTEGPMAAWEQLKEIASEMKDAFIEAVKDWIKWKIVQKAIETVLAMFIPGAGIIRAIIGIYDTVVFFIQKAKDIMQMIGNFLGSIAEIAAGNIGAAAAALEAGLARGLVLVIDFLARFLRLSGITKQIQDAIHKVREKVDGVIAKVAGWIVVQARKLGKLIAGGARSAVARIREWWRVRRPFQTASGERHTLYFQGEGASARLYMATEPRSIEAVLADDTLSIPNRAALRTRLTQLQDRIAKAATATARDPAQQERDQEALQRHVEDEVIYFAAQLAQHLGDVANLPPTAVTYQTGSDARPVYVKAEPLTINPGNTTGSEADGNRDHVAGFTRIVSKWEQKTGEHTRKGHKNPTLRSRVTGTHILAAAFHGPFRQSWNVVLTDQALNNRMTRGPEAEAKKLFKTTKLSYEVRVSYYAKERPGIEAETVDTAEVAQVKNWVGYYISINIHVLIKKWNASKNAYTDPVYNSDVTADLPPVQGERIAQLDEQIVAILKKAVVAGQDYTATDGKVYAKTNYSGVDLREEVRADTGRTDMKIAAMKREPDRRLYGPPGPGARLYILKTLL